MELPLISELKEWKVQNLMIPSSREWNHEIIVNIFEDRDAKAILEIPLRQWHIHDTRIWNFSKDGNYTVKTGYHVAMSLDENLESRRIQGNWNSLWKIKVPQKINQFLWRACRECLPNRINLQKKGIQVPPPCVLFNEGLETS